MFSNKPNYVKLRTNLRLCINRLKLLEKKKTELALKARREIADYIAVGKDDRARIRVEHIIREDYLVEAMEIIEMLCDLLLARFGLIERMSELDPGIEEAVATIIWVSPRLSADVQEIREVAHQLVIKYGKEFGEVCRRNGFESVNEKVVHKMSLAAPPKILVENYMIEIARTYKVPFEPDPLVMMGQPPEVNNLIDLGVDALASSGGTGKTDAGYSAAELKAIEAGQAVGGGGHMPPFLPSVPSAGSACGPGMMPGGGFGNFNNNMGGIGRGGSGGGYSAAGIDGFGASGGINELGGGGGGGGGFPYGNTNNGYCAGGVISDGGSHAGSSSLGGVGVGSGSHGPSNDFFVGGKGVIGGPGATATAGGSSESDCSAALIGGVPVLPSQGQFPPPIPQGYLPPSGVHPVPSQPSQTPSDPMEGNSNRAPLNSQMSWITDDCLPSLPSYDQATSSPDQYPTVPRSQQGPSTSNAGPIPNSTGMGSINFPDVPNFPEIPGLPCVPSNSVGGAPGGGDDIDFDDLTRRFEELKKRK